MAAPAPSLDYRLAYARSQAIAAYEQSQLDDDDGEKVTEQYRGSTVIRRVNARTSEDMADAFTDTYIFEAQALLPSDDIYIDADTEFHLFLFGKSRPADANILIDWLTSHSAARPSLIKRLNRIPLYDLDSMLRECYKSPFTKVKADLLHRIESGLADADLDWARKSLIRELSRPVLKLSMLDGFAELASVHAGRENGFASAKDAIRAAKKAGKLQEVVRDFMQKNPQWMEDYSVQRLADAMDELAHADEAAGLAGRGKLASYNLTLKQLKADGFIDLVASHTGKEHVGQSVGAAVHAAKKAGVLDDVVRDFKSQNRKWKNIDIYELVATRNKLAHSSTS